VSEIAFWEKVPSQIGKFCVVKFANLGRNLIALNRILGIFIV